MREINERNSSAQQNIIIIEIIIRSFNEIWT